MKNYPLLVLMFAAAAANAGPFGLQQGMTLEQVKKLGNFKPEPSSTYSYSATKLVNGHADFELYSVLVTPQYGLCKIKAIGKDVSTSAYGSELSGQFQDLLKALTRKYGAPESTHDFLRHGSIWNEPRDWMMGLVKEERSLAAYWLKPANANLPDAIQAIGINTRALSASKGYLTLSYEFNNFAQCVKVVESARDSNL